MAHTAHVRTGLTTAGTLTEVDTIYSELLTTPMQQTRVDVFEGIFLVFLGLGTLVGVVVVAYTLYNAYKYRDGSGYATDDEKPKLGELPTGGTGGKKLFVSFGLSAIIVVSLVVWTYGMLLYVEDPGDNPGDDAIEIDVEGFAFGWDFYYDNGVETTDEMVIPADERVWIDVTATDVWHTFGISQERVKADAIPGEHDQTWFIAETPGTYEEAIECFELCGAGHSGMNADLVVLEPDEFDSWLDEQLTLELTLENEEGERVTEDFELVLEHQDEEYADHVYEFTDDEFEDGEASFTHEDVERGGVYTVTITATGDQDFETVETEIEFTGPTEETIEVEGAEGEPVEDEEEDDGADDGEADDDETEDEEENDGDDEQTDDEENDEGDEDNEDGGDD